HGRHHHLWAPGARAGLPRRGERAVSIDWNDVYRSTFPDLVRFLHRKVWDAERARDLAQEAFVRALRHEPKRPRAWLFQVAANLARDEARMVLRRKKHLVLLKGEAEAREEGVKDPAAEMDERERWGKVRAALDALSEKDREALLLWDAGQSYTEIARHTGLAVGAVGTTLARARKRLAEAYEQREQADVAHR
ncbi:MAG: sigma-70 family RNA polymerase sigma factor, partial [Gemmatimonadota bacterium]